MSVQLPHLLQKSFSRPSWTAVREGDFLAFSLNIRSVIIVPIFEKPETWPV